MVVELPVAVQAVVEAAAGAVDVAAGHVVEAVGAEHVAPAAAAESLDAALVQ